ncbi:hypothetical protein HK096_007973 [Nowakowskiella sp. JEL0078]|nr:hypothetical protein HK096_007973 [Nowakowskiella sp. JEL0078]
MRTIKWALISFSAARNSFRENSGLVAMMSILISIEGIYLPEAIPQFEKVFTFSENDELTVSLVQENDIFTLANRFVFAWFELLISSIKDHEISRKFLFDQIGYSAIEDAILLTGSLNVENGFLVIGCLFALAFEDSRIIEELEKNLKESTKLQSSETNTTVPHLVESLIFKILCNPTSILKNTKVIVSILKLLLSVSESLPHLPMFALKAIFAISNANKHNQVKLNGVGLMRIVLDWTFGVQKCWFIRSINSSEKITEYQIKCVDLLKLIMKRIIEGGISDSELRYLFTSGNTTENLRNESRKNLHPFAAEVITHSLRYGRHPSYIHFDHNMNDICCLLMDNFGRPFPPINGYSLFLWIRVQKFDSSFDIPILGIMDEENHVRLLITLENGSRRKLRIQTLKNTVCYEKFQFSENEWYHVALVHQKPRISSSFLDLYVNGKLIERLKFGYLGHPGSACRIHSFIGLPPDMKRPEKSSAIWSLGPCYMIEDFLLDSQGVNTIYNLGVQYTANFQGSLEKYKIFQNIQNPSPEIFSKERSTPNVLINPIQILMSQIKVSQDLNVPEEKILFAITAENFMERYIRNHQNESEVTNTFLAAKIGIKGFFNSANPKINPDQTIIPSIVQIRGDLVVSTPLRMNDGIWKLGGCAMLLKLVDMSEVNISILNLIIFNRTQTSKLDFGITP